MNDNIVTCRKQVRKSIQTKTSWSKPYNVTFTHLERSKSFFSCSVHFAFLQLAWFHSNETIMVTHAGRINITLCDQSFHIDLERR